MKVITRMPALALGTIVALCITIPACSPEVQEPGTLPSEYARQAFNAESAVAGYRHTSSASRFALGQVVALQDDGITEKVVGEEGVFATNRRTGWTAALPNATSSLAAKAPLLGVEAHSEAVKSYFVAAGLPEDQVSSVAAHGTSHTDIDDRSKLVGEGYSAVLSRTVDGFPVPESFAWARMNIDREVVMESVYWPDVPASTIALAKDLAAAATSTAFSTAVGTDTTRGAAVIHHSAGYENSVLFTVTYDVPGRGAMASVRHFDKKGVEVALATDVPTTPSTQRP